MKINPEKFRSPSYVFFLYVLTASLVLLIFRYIFPGEDSPLPIFSRDWRLIQGLITIISLFPAIALSALVVPFGIASGDEDAYTIYSSRLFLRMISPLTTAIVSAGLFAVLFFLVLPLARNHENNMRFQGEMYRMARERAFEHARAGEWIEASQFIGISDSIWNDSPELTELRTDIGIRIAEIQLVNQVSETPPGVSIASLPGQWDPVDAPDAIEKGEVALREGRFFDAHWLATLGRRIAREGSPEEAAASRLASLAWNEIQNLQPTAAELHAHALYRLKMSGYQAMVSGEWIRAFYIFQELVELSPNDPDALNFLEISDAETRKVAFFIDEMEVSPGETLTNAVFSLPWEQESWQQGSGLGGRLVMRVTSLSSTPDVAYGIGLEFMVFNSDAHLLLSLEAPYAKFLPIVLDNQHKVLVMMRALDRHDSERYREPLWSASTGVPIGGSGIYHAGSAQVTLNVSYETFLMLSQMRQGLPSMQFSELYAAKDISLEAGYIPEVFEAEILNRLGACLFFLPMAVIAIVIGWNFRAIRRPRYFFALSLPLLPVVFNVIVYLCRTILSIVGTSLIFAVGFSAAFPLFIGILSVCFLLSLILLAAQHG